ncbi:MAG: hypothetical protein IPK13_06815 [Deltaproteobacteria bacterium]|nr:hypothetical protein [Deltaproteobacteria bacterium]
MTEPRSVGVSRTGVGAASSMPQEVRRLVGREANDPRQAVEEGAPWDEVGEGRSSGRWRDVAAIGAGTLISGGAGAAVRSALKAVEMTAEFANPAALGTAAMMAVSSAIAFAVKKRFVHEDDSFLKKVWIALPCMFSTPVYMLAKPGAPVCEELASAKKAARTKASLASQKTTA